MSVRLRRIKTQWKTTNPADVSLVLTGTVALITTVLLYKLVLLPGARPSSANCSANGERFRMSSRFSASGHL